MSSSMSIIKGFLCSHDGTYTFPLAPKITTIGRENCDITLNSSNIDSQHAVIEFIEHENCFVLQDLNSTNGTYVNDCRVQNAAVRIALHDSIRFGYNGAVFNLVIQEESNTPSIPPINTLNRPQAQPLKLISQTIASRGSTQMPSQNNQQSIWTNMQPNATLGFNQRPCGPATLRSRNSSAPLKRPDINTSISPKINCWVKGNNGEAYELELNGHNRSPHQQQSNDLDLNAKICQLEKDMRLKNIEIKDLTDKLNSIQFHQSNSTNTQSSAPNEMEQLKRDKSVATGLVNTMQKDLAIKEASISKFAREMEALKKEIREKTSQNQELTEKLSCMKDFKKSEEEKQNKEKEILVLKNKFKTTEQRVVELNNQVLQIKGELEDSQKQVFRNIQNEKTLKDELEHVKIQLHDCQRSERSVKIELEQSKRLYEKFHGLMIKTIYSCPGLTQPQTDLTDADLVDNLKRIFNEKIVFSEKCDELSKSLNESNQANDDLLNDLNEFSARILSFETDLKDSNRRASKLQRIIEEFSSVTSNEQLTNLRNSFNLLYSNESSQIQLIERQIASFDVEIDNEHNFDELFKDLKEKLDAERAKAGDLEMKIEELKTLMVLEKSKTSDEYQENLVKSLTKLECELKEKHDFELGLLTNNHNEAINALKSELEVVNTQLSETKSSLSDTSETLNEKIAALNAQIDEINKQREEIEQKAFQDRDLYAENLQSLQNEKSHLETRLNQEYANYCQELKIHKEQIKQHSLTIVELEKESSRVRQRELELTNKQEQVRKREKELEEKLKSFPSPTSSLEQLNLERLCESLRTECHMLKQKIIDQDDLISVLKRDVVSATAKLTDVRGEMTDKQKRDLERNKALVNEQTKELAHTRSQLSALSEIIDKQKEQIEQHKNETNKYKTLVEKYQKSAEENGLVALELKKKIDNEQTQIKKHEVINKEEGKITSELTAIGAQCKGERHEQVIARQREALNELRQRVKLLEQSRPSMPTSQTQMQQQIILLKKQLAELRASQAFSEDIARQANATFSGGDNSLLMIEEKTAHYETQTALEASEETYLTLLRSIGSMLELNELNGYRTMNNLPQDERDRLIAERGHTMDVICGKLRSLKETLERKDKLLKDYELDLARLRQTEFLLQKKSEQLDEAQMSSRNKSDEIEYMREALRNSKLNLDKEKLVNSSIKHKRPMSSFIINDKARKNSTDQLHHHCPPDDKHTRIVRKTFNEKLKKKDYELKQLKDELKYKHEELNDLTSKLNRSSEIYTN